MSVESSALNVERSAPRGAVFLSYASQDAEAARRIAEALRAVGVEVWFDQNELVGGDAWDAKIRGQISSCALFVPVISANTQARQEGYFRLEWKLAEDRSHLMAKGKAFIVPVSVDATTERGALVPDAFLAVQWMKLPGGETSPAFVARVQKLMGGTGAALPAAASPSSAPMVNASATKSGRPSLITIALGVAVLALVAYVVVRPGAKEVPAPTAPAKLVAETKPAPPTPAPAPALAPLAPEKSVAVLPFENLSPDKDNAFFADGVHEDVITSLTKIRDLKVIGRTSVLPYRDPATRNHKQIAADLGVATLLEGTVRRAGTKVRVTAQLINARTDESLWAETYDVDLTDAFTIQSALAQNITAALKANFTSGERAYVAERPTQNQEAYDLYLRARSLMSESQTRDTTERAIALYEQATKKDPSFVAAYAQLAYLNGRMYWYGYMDPTPARKERARSARDTAVRLGPGRPETRLAVGTVAYFCDDDWARGLEEYRAAAAVQPNDAQLFYLMGVAFRRVGQPHEAVASLARSLELNPKDTLCASTLGQTIYGLRRYADFLELHRRYALTADWNSAAAHFALSHDYALFVHELDSIPSNSSRFGSARTRFFMAYRSGDLREAGHIISEPGFPAICPFSDVLDDPTELSRAVVAFASGKKAEAGPFAEAALAWYEKQVWNPRQQALGMTHVALAHALVGHELEARRLIKEGLARLQTDKFNLETGRIRAAEVYVVLDRIDDAIATIRELMTGPTYNTTADILRLEPMFARLKDHPRFEEILKSAKPL